MDNYLKKQSLLAWQKPKAHLNVSGSAGRYQTTPLIHFKKLHRGSLTFPFCLTFEIIWPPCFADSSLPLLLFGGDNKEKILPRGQGLGFHWSQPWERIRDLGRREMFFRTMESIQGLPLSSCLSNPIVGFGSNSLTMTDFKLQP